jgi:hypothetical protein
MNNILTSSNHSKRNVVGWKSENVKDDELVNEADTIHSTSNNKSGEIQTTNHVFSNESKKAKKTGESRQLYYTQSGKSKKVPKKFHPTDFLTRRVLMMTDWIPKHAVLDNNSSNNNNNNNNNKSNNKRQYSEYEKGIESEACRLRVRRDEPLGSLPDCRSVTTRALSTNISPEACHNMDSAIKSFIAPICEEETNKYCEKFDLCDCDSHILTYTRNTNDMTDSGASSRQAELKSQNNQKIIPGHARSKDKISVLFTKHSDSKQSQIISPSPLWVMTRITTWRSRAPS